MLCTMEIATILQHGKSCSLRFNARPPLPAALVDRKGPSTQTNDNESMVTFEQTDPSESRQISGGG
jgi:hypothetical protein